METKEKKVFLTFNKVKKDEILRGLNRLLNFSDNMKAIINKANIDYTTENLRAFLKVNRSEVIDEAEPDINGRLILQRGNVKIEYLLPQDDENRIKKLLNSFIKESEPVSYRIDMIEKLITSFSDAKEEFFKKYIGSDKFDYIDLFASLVKVKDGKSYFSASYEQTVVNMCSVFVTTPKGLALYGKVKNIAKDINSLKDIVHFNMLDIARGETVLNFFEENDTGEIAPSNVDYDLIAN